MEADQARHRGEVIRTAVINGITCAILTAVIGFLAISPWVTAWIIVLVLVLPFLLMKWPQLIQTRLLGRENQAPEKSLTRAAIGGGCLGIVGLIVALICGIIIYIPFYCQTHFC